jgi:hypothetical protein
MRTLAVLLLLASAAQAQPLPPLPPPDLPASAPVADILRAAQRAVAANRLGEAQEALEMAQTRLLDRSVPLFETRTPSDDPVAATVARARAALQAGERDTCLGLIDAALAGLGR